MLYPLFRVSVLIAGIGITFPRLAQAQYDAHRAQSLAGYKTITFVLEDLQPPMVQAGLNSDSIRSRVMRRLKQGGIEVGPTPGGAHFYIGLHTFPNESGEKAYALTSQCAFRQAVRRLFSQPTTSTDFLIADTWSVTPVLGLATSSTMRGFALEILDQCLDQFIDAWQKANPKH